MVIAKSFANHMQHTGRVSCTACQEPHVTKRLLTTIKSDKVEIAFILALFYLLKPLTNDGGEEIVVPGDNPRLKPENSNRAET